MSRLPTSRFPPPVLYPPPAVPSKAAPPFRPSASSPVLYDSDSYDEDGGSFQLLPSPEHYLSGSGDSPRPATARHSATQPVMYDEEEELVSPSSSYNSMSPSQSLDQLPQPALSERKSAIRDVGGADGGRPARTQVSRNNRVQHRNALRLDLMDADEDESVNEEDEEAADVQKRSHGASHATAAQPIVSTTKRPSTVFSAPSLPVSITSAPSTASFSSVVPGASLSRNIQSRLTSASPVPVPVRSTPASYLLSSSTSDVSLPSASYDEYNDSMLSGHSLNDSPVDRFERMRRSGRDEYDEEDDGLFDHSSADVIELEDEERERASSGSAGVSQRGGRALSATQAVAVPPADRSTPSPQLTPLLSTLPPTLHPSSSSSVVSSWPTASPALVTSSSLPVMPHSSRPLRTVVPMTVRTSSDGAIDDEGEDGDDEHDDQHNEETDETSSAIISLPTGTQDQHDTVRSFNGGAAPSLLRTLTSSYSIQPPSLSHHASTSSTSSVSSSSSSSSHVSAVTELPTSPPTSGADDGEADEYNDGNVMVVTSPHHSHSPSRAHQQPGQATDEEEESEPAFRLQEQEEESQPRSQPQTPIMLPATIIPSTTSRGPSHVSIVDDDEFAEAKLRREKLIAGKAARLAKKSKHERWEMDSSIRSESKRRSAARKISKRSNERRDSSDDSSSSSNSSSSSSSETERSDNERREAAGNSDRAGNPGTNNDSRRSPTPHAPFASPPSPAHHPVSRPSSRSSSPMKAACRPLQQHDDPLRQPPQHHHHPQHNDEAAVAWRRTSTKQREEQRPSDNSRESSPLPPSHPLTLQRTGSHSSRSLKKKKKRGSNEDEIRVADLEFKEKIGEGAYGDVYRGYLWGQEIAIKQIRLDGGKEEAEEETVREFRREMKIMKHLRHPNVVEFLGACMSEQSLCLLTEYMPNGSLEDHLTRLRREGKRMREGRVVSMSLDVVKGLNWLHHKGIIHRDLKSANILLDAAGRVKLADFGLSHVRRRRDESMDGYHGVAGTPSYIAPEVLMGREYGVKADVYSLGVLINEMLTTVAPYDDTPLAQLDLPVFEAAVMAGERPKLAESKNAALTQLAVDCWQADADSRPTVESIMKTLERIDRDMQAQQQQQFIANATEAASSSLDDLPTPLRSLLASDFARLYQMQAALAEQERQLQARSVAMASEKAAREEEHKQWEEIRERHKSREQG